MTSPPGFPPGSSLGLPPHPIPTSTPRGSCPPGPLWGFLPTQSQPPPPGAPAPRVLFGASSPPNPNPPGGEGDDLGVSLPLLGGHTADLPSPAREVAGDDRGVGQAPRWGGAPRLSPVPPPMPGHLDVVEGLSLPAGYRRGDIARGGDQEPGDRFYSFTTFFLSPNAFSWCACPLRLHALIHFLSLLPCLLGRCSVRDIVDQGRPRIVHCEYAMLGALGFTPRRARGGIYVWCARAPGPWVCCFKGCAARAALLRD